MGNISFHHRPAGAKGEKGGNATASRGAREMPPPRHGPLRGHCCCCYSLYSFSVRQPIMLNERYTRRPLPTAPPRGAMKHSVGPPGFLFGPSETGCVPRTRGSVQNNSEQSLRIPRDNVINLSHQGRLLCVSSLFFPPHRPPPSSSASSFRNLS